MPTVVHIVLFRFRGDVSQDKLDTFASEVKKLKSLPSVKDNRLLVGSPSITDPIAKSQGYQYALVGFHESKEQLAAYSASKEHQDAITQHMLPYIDSAVVFDFEVPADDEYMVGSITKGYEPVSA